MSKFLLHAFGLACPVRDEIANLIKIDNPKKKKKKSQDDPDSISAVKVSRLCRAILAEVLATSMLVYVCVGMNVSIFFLCISIPTTSLQELRLEYHIEGFLLRNNSSRVATSGSFTGLHLGCNHLYIFANIRRSRQPLCNPRMGSVWKVTMGCGTAVLHRSG